MKNKSAIGAGHISASARPHQPRWDDQERVYYMSCMYTCTLYLYKESDSVELPHGLPVLWRPGQQVQSPHTHLHHLIHVHPVLWSTHTHTSHRHIHHTSHRHIHHTSHITHTCTCTCMHPRQLIFLRKSDCLGYAVLLCLVCLFDLACFFLPSSISH